MENNQPKFYKKTMDIIGASLGLIILAPFYPFIALAIKLESKGPIIVKLDRVSQGKVIKVYKFRSMIKDAQKIKPDLAGLNERKDGSFFKIKKDPRITKVGKLFRKFRIDEFPQLINVLKGELSLVGPRPHEPGEVSAYPTEFQHLFLAKAGVTGLSQVNGASSLPFLKELTLDNYYLKNQSLWLDFKIIIKTILILFFDPTAV
ncbi:MAG: sugar transferase [bacterium]|nr:sugar transferase [bacterium]